MIRKVPSYLKGLAETRARADAEAIRLTRLLGQVQASLEKATQERDACDMLIRRLDNRLDPTRITPTFAWKGRYGKRGNMGESVLGLLRSVYPAILNTGDVLTFVLEEFGHAVVNAKDAKVWKCNRIIPCLRRLQKQGLVRKPEDDNGESADGWVWVPDGGQSLDSMREEFGAADDRPDEISDVQR